MYACLLRSVDWTLLWFLYSSFQPVCAAPHQITLQNSFRPHPQHSRLYKHICTNNILVKRQNGFRINSTAEAASFDVINEILKGMNNRLSVGGIFCDLEKAFDCVNH